MMTGRREGAARPEDRRRRIFQCRLAVEQDGAKLLIRLKNEGSELARL